MFLIMVKVKIMADYTALSDEELVKENLINNRAYMSDVRGFLAERNNEVYNTRAEEFDAMLEHMRKQKIGNEITVLGDLQYAQDADEASKQRFGRITNVFDRLQGEDDWLTPRGFQKLGDYAEGVFKSPSTYIGLLTGGGGKAASIAAAQGLRFGIRKILATSLKGAIPAMAVEGTIGAITGAAEQEVRSEIGLEGDWKRGALIGGGIGMFAGTVGGGLPSGIAAVRARKQGKILAESKAAQEKMKASVRSQTRQLLTDPENKKLSVIFSKQLKKLDETMVKEGIEIKKRLGPAGEEEFLVASLSPETRQGIIGAAIEVSRMKDKSGKAIFHSDDPTTRITERVSLALTNGSITPSQLQSITKKYNITIKEFASLVMADVSEGARLMRAMRTIKEALNPKEVIEAMTKAAKKETGEAAEEARAIDNFISSSWEGVRNFDKFRISLMTSQPATTIRNAANVGLRLPLHMIEYLFTGGSIKEAVKMPYNLFDKSSADLFATAFSDAIPEVSKRIFRGAMDVEYSLGSTSIFAKAGRGVNFLNTKVDNAVKKTLLLGEFRKIAGGSDKLNDIISRGELKSWIGENEELVNRAIKDALSLVYQKGYSRTGEYLPERIAGRFIHMVANSKYSPIWTPLIPFPRYIVNQLEFVYKHMPILGLTDPLYHMARGKKLPPKAFAKRIGEQVTGLGMLYGALQYRASQGPEVKWYQHKDDQGRITDIKALLGPFAPFMFLADVIYRMSEGKNRYLTPLADASTKKFDFNQVDNREAMQALTGVATRAGTGLYILDKLMENIGDNTEALLSTKPEVENDALSRMWRRFAADYANTFTIPVGLYRDLEATFDPEGRKIMDNQRIDLGELFFNYALRTLPNTGDSGVLQSLRGEQVEQEFPGGGGQRTRFMPFVRQITGLTPTYGFEGKPVLEKEITRLGITNQEYFKRNPKDPPALTRLMKSYMNRVADGQITGLIRNKDYRDRDPVEQRDILLKEVGKFKTKARKFATNALKKELSTARSEFNKLSKYRKERILKMYRKKYNKSLVKEKDYMEGLAINRSLGE